MKIQVQTFAGIVPKVSPRLLAESQAQVAQNTRLESGDLETWLGLSPEQALTRSAARSLYRFKGRYWFEWGENVDAVRAPLPGDGSAQNCVYSNPPYSLGSHASRSSCHASLPSTGLAHECHGNGRAVAD